MRITRVIVATLIILTAYAVYAAYAQQSTYPSQSAIPTVIAPQLSTADRVAIQSLEKTKQDATKQWNDALQQELSIIREWNAAHPGFHVHFTPNDGSDPKNFSIEEDQKPQPAKSPEPPKR